MSTTTTTATSTNPTAGLYQCGSGCGTLTFTWTTNTYPGGGRTGTVTLGQFVNKPIQVFDVHIKYDPVSKQEIYRDWGFQAQDGSFVGRMLVSSPGHSYIRFVNFRPNDQWPQVACHVPVPDPRDSPV